MFSYSRKIYISVIILDNKRENTTKAVLNLSCLAESSTSVASREQSIWTWKNREHKGYSQVSLTMIYQPTKRTDSQTDMALSTRLLILIKNICNV